MGPQPQPRLWLLLHAQMALWTVIFPANSVSPPALVASIYSSVLHTSIHKAIFGESSWIQPFMPSVLAHCACATVLHMENQSHPSQRPCADLGSVSDVPLGSLTSHTFFSVTPTHSHALLSGSCSISYTLGLHSLHPSHSHLSTAAHTLSRSHT